MIKKQKTSHSISKIDKTKVLPKLPPLPPVPQQKPINNSLSSSSSTTIQKRKGRKRKYANPEIVKQQNYVKKLKQKKKRQQNQQKLQEKVNKEVMIPIDSGTFEKCCDVADDRVNNIKKSLVDLQKDLNIIQQASKDYMTVTLKTIKSESKFGQELGKILAGYAKILLNDLKSNKQEIARLHGVIIRMKHKVTSQQYIIEKMSENLSKMAPRFVATQHQLAVAKHHSIYDPEYIAMTEGGDGICPSELND